MPQLDLGGVVSGASMCSACVQALDNDDLNISDQLHRGLISGTVWLMGFECSTHCALMSGKDLACLDHH